MHEDSLTAQTCMISSVIRAYEYMDYPASIMFHSAWYKQYAYVEGYYARIHMLLSLGKPVMLIAGSEPSRKCLVWSLPQMVLGTGTVR